MDNTKFIKLLEELCSELGYRIYPTKGVAIMPWNVEDVHKVRPDLTLEEAVEVLRLMESEFDASVGMNWSTLEEAAEELFPLAEYRDNGSFDIIYKIEDNEYRLDCVYFVEGEYEGGNWRSNIYKELFNVEEISDYEKRDEIINNSEMYCAEHKSMEEALEHCRKNINNSKEDFDRHSIRKYKDFSIDIAVKMLEDCEIGYAIIEA